MRTSKAAVSPARTRSTTCSSVQLSSRARSRMGAVAIVIYNYGADTLRKVTGLPRKRTGLHGGSGRNTGVLHLVPDLVGQLFDLLGLLNHVNRHDVFVGLVHVLL